MYIDEPWQVALPSIDICTEQLFYFFTVTTNSILRPNVILMEKT